MRRRESIEVGGGRERDAKREREGGLETDRQRERVHISFRQQTRSPSCVSRECVGNTLCLPEPGSDLMKAALCVM